MRVWDTFVVDTNNFGQAVSYAADNQFEVVEGAVGGLFNSSFDRQAFQYAYSKGTLPVLVSSDLNTADHNFPTDYDQAMMVQGTVADVNGLGMDAPARAAAVPDRPSGTDQRPGGNVVPKLRHHPVRRPRSHRDARDHRLGGHRAGLGRRRPARQLRG